VAAVIDRAEGRTTIFVNGRERTPNVWSQKNSLPVALSSAPWRVGALEVEKGKTAYFAQGDLAEIRVYNRALASEEVQVVYRAAPAGLQK
jgi:hypothetical protein